MQIHLSYAGKKGKVRGKNPDAESSLDDTTWGCLPKPEYSHEYKGAGIFRHGRVGFRRGGFADPI